MHNDKTNRETSRFYIRFLYHDDRLFLKHLSLGFSGECLAYFGWIQVFIFEVFLQTFMKLFSFSFVCYIFGCKWYTKVTFFFVRCRDKSQRMALYISPGSTHLLVEPTCPSQEGRHFLSRACKIENLFLTNISGLAECSRAHILFLKRIKLNLIVTEL